MSLAKSALQNSRTINVVRLALALLGVLTLFSLPREQYPNVPLYYVHVLVPYPGASAEEIEKEITQKVEKKTKGLENINSVTSTISDGLSFTRIAYDQSISSEEFTSNYLELQSLINNIDMPENALTPIVDNYTYLDFLSIVDVVVYADDDVDTGILMETSKRIQSNLEFISGVSSVSTIGLLDKKIQILLNENEMKKNFISLAEVSEAIRQQNINIPAGILKTDKYIINVKTSSQSNNIQALQDILIRSQPNPIYLGDIATIDYFYDTSNEQLQYNRQRSTSLKIYKTENADSIQLVENIREEITSLENNLPEGIHLSTFADTTDGIKNSLNVLSSNAILGFVLLCLSLLLFLGWKAAIISALEIPFTFATSFFILKLLGITLNTSTLFALVLVLGMIVDHSIVILENIIRLRHFHNHNRLDSVVKGISEVSFPVISSTLTTIGTFLPLAFMPGLIGKFLLPVPITITITLVISTVSALVIIPIHYIEFPGNDRTHELKIFNWGREVLSFLLRRILKYKFVSCFVALLIAGVSIFSLFNIPVSLYDTEDQPLFFVDYTLPIGTSIEESKNFMNMIEDGVMPLVEEGTISSVITAIGNTNRDPEGGITFDYPHNAQLQIEVPAQNKENLVNIDHVIKQVVKKLDEVEKQELPLDYTRKIRKQRTGPPTSSAIGFRILGDNIDDLQNIATEITTILESYDELGNISNNFDQNKTELTIKIDEEEAKKHGYTNTELGFLIRQWISNDAISSLFINNEQSDIIVNVSDIDNEEKKDLRFMSFPSKTTGQLIKFEDIASIETNTILNSIYRENEKRVLKITADSYSRERIREINDRIQTFFDDNLAKKYPNTIFQIGGEFDEFSTLLDDIMVLLLIGIFIVYVILVSEFKSYVQPILIMLTILFTSIGVSFYLHISDSSLSITILYSFVALVGVVVNGSIVLVSTANNIFRNDPSITHKEAILQASLQRFKPIILTNFTTILGVLPTALGLNGKSPIWQPMASTIAVGLLFSTITTLIVIPAFYALLPNSREAKHLI